MRYVCYGLLISMLILCGCATTTATRFESCENVHGGGFFWLDSSSGKLWWADKMNSKWKFCGTPEGALPGHAGRYKLNENRTGAGVFVLDTETGAGWWTNVKEWQSYGNPED